MLRDTIKVQLVVPLGRSKYSDLARWDVLLA